MAGMQSGQAGNGAADVVIDIHAHMLVPQAAEHVPVDQAPELDEFIRYAGERSNAYNRSGYAAVQPHMLDVDVRLREMDRMGVQYQAVAIAPAQYYYWADPDAGAKAATVINDGIAETVAQHPDRLVGMGTLPMQYPDAAVEELERVCGTLGFRGVSINPSAQGVDYDDSRYEAFWAKAAELDTTVILHPNGFCSGERLSDYYLINVVGNPLETTVALTRIILGGVLERHPSLKIVSVHGGGYLGFYMDRMDHATQQRDDVGYNLSRLPSEYLKQMYFDTVVHSPEALAYLLSRVGAEHMVLGTDYPYDMGVMDPVPHVDAIPGLDPADRSLIVGANAAKLLRLDI